jgi:hypothetical protein
VARVARVLAHPVGERVMVGEQPRIVTAGAQARGLSRAIDVE